MPLDSVLLLSAPCHQNAIIMFLVNNQILPQPTMSYACMYKALMQLMIDQHAKVVDLVESNTLYVLLVYHCNSSGILEKLRNGMTN